MLLLSRYLVKQVALITLVISVVLTLIIWLTQSLRLLDFIINGGAPMRIFAGCEPRRSRWAGSATRTTSRAPCSGSAPPTRRTSPARTSSSMAASR